MANTINWGISYSYSYWGNGQNDVSWGDDYYVAYLTSSLRRRATLEVANSVTSFANGTSFPLTTFTSSANNVTSGIVSSAFGGCVSNAITLKEDQTVKVTFDYTQNSGDELRVLFSNVATGAGATISDVVTISGTGTFVHIFTITSDATGYLQLGTGNSGHSINFSALNVKAQILPKATDPIIYENNGETVKLLEEL